MPERFFAHPHPIFGIKKVYETLRKSIDIITKLVEK